MPKAGLKPRNSGMTAPRRCLRTLEGLGRSGAGCKGSLESLRPRKEHLQLLFRHCKQLKRAIRRAQAYKRLRSPACFAAPVCVSRSSSGASLVGPCSVRRLQAPRQLSKVHSTGTSDVVAVRKPLGCPAIEEHHGSGHCQGGAPGQCLAFRW